MEGRTPPCEEAELATIRASGLIDQTDSLLLVIDLQEPFLRKIDPAVAERLTDRARFLVEVALGLGIPLFVTVEDPARHGLTAQPVGDLLPPDLIQHDKRVFGLAGQPDLTQAILAQPRRTAVIVGLETDVCVLHTAVGLLALGFRTAIVQDATGAPGEEHALGLARAAALGVELVHAKGLYYEWVRSLDGLKTLAAARTIARPLGSKL
jgi:nicotinamidase-related amidase